MNRPHRDGFLVMTNAVLLGLLLGCQTQLATPDFLRRYEKECVVTMERGAYSVLAMYQSPEYLAALQAGPNPNPDELVSLVDRYSQGIYVRIAIRLVQASGGDDTPDTQLKTITGGDPLFTQVLLGERLKEMERMLPKLIKLSTKNGMDVQALSASLQRGIRTGAGNTIIAVFPRENQGTKVEVDDCELVIDDLGLNLGTLRNKLVRPKGFELKAAT